MEKIRTLVTVIQYSSSELVLNGLNLFREKYGDFFSNIHIYYVEEIEAGDIREEEFGSVLEKADLVLIDVRSNRITARVLKEKLDQRTDVNVAVLLSAGVELMKISRLGDFHLGSYMSKFVKDKKINKDKGKEDDIEVFHEKKKEKPFDPKKIFVIQKIIKFFGTILPFGNFKHSKRLFKMMDWWQSGEVDNFICILELIASEYMDLKIDKKQKQKAKKYHHAAFWHPDRDDMECTIKKYIKKYPLKPELPTLLIVFYGGYHFATSVLPVKSIFDKYNDSWNIIAFYTDGIFTTKYLKKYLNVKNIPFDAILSLIWFPFNGGPLGGNLEETHNILEQWNVPVFLGCCLYNQQYKDFLDRKEGLTPLQILAAVIFPEMDGIIDPIPLLANDEEERKIGNQKMNLITPHIFQDNLDLIMRRIDARIKLKKLKNSEKKLAFILFNYPPGEAGIGNAAYFDSFESTCNILKILKTHGYDLPNPNGVNFYHPSELKDWFIEKGFVNSAKWFTLEDRVTGAEENNGLNLVKISKKKYLSWYQKLDEGLRKTVEKTWGAPPGKIQVVSDNLYLPIAKFGNIYLGIQPSRGDVEDLDKSYHDYTLPPHHEYLAFYYYIVNELQAHALIHLGTHGTLEFLPGKEVGIKKEFCYNHSMLDYIPHFYVYQISNTSEAMIAKRRSLGTLISYQLPPFGKSELDANFQELEERIHLLKESMLMNNPSVEENKRKILEDAGNYGFTVFDIDELENEIVKCKTSLIPEGLHVFGKGYDLDAAVDYLWSIQSMIPHRPNLYELLATEFDLPKNASENLQLYLEENINDPIRIKVKETGTRVLKDIILGEDLKNLRIKYPDLEFLHDNYLDKLIGIISVLGKNSMENSEISNLIEGLNGNYVPPAMGGDPIRTPDVLPSGYNLYQFNPQLIPTDMALKRGYEAAEQTLELYRREHHGKYPKNVAVVLWGFETAKTHGEAIGQILAYLGLKVSELKTWRREPELIPLSELKRPRIDVTINICGFMRDLFSHVLEFLDEAIDLVIDADEPLENNYVKANYRELKKELMEDKMNEKDAEFMARSRVFGPDVSEYGTTLTTLIESGAWKKPEDLGNAYLNQMQFVYRRNLRAKPARKMFQKKLKSVDAISQIRDSVAYAITDLDHYYEFVGGLSQAAVASGKKNLPHIYITDTTSVKVETTSIKTAINRGVITRTANPKWIKAMLKHDYSGGKKISNNVNYLLGFSATTQQVEDKTWDKVFENIINDKEIQQMMRKNNAYALHDLVGGLLEAIQRKLWNASEDKEKLLKELYLELEGHIEK